MLTHLKMTIAVSLIDTIAEKITDLVDQLIEVVAFLIPVFLSIVFVLGLFRLVDLYVCKHSECFLPNVRHYGNAYAF